jgi:hypothetical protein
MVYCSVLDEEKVVRAFPWGLVLVFACCVNHSEWLWRRAGGGRGLILLTAYPVVLKCASKCALWEALWQRQARVPCHADARQPYHADAREPAFARALTRQKMHHGRQNPNCGTVRDGKTTMNKFCLPSAASEHSIEDSAPFAELPAERSARTVVSAFRGPAAYDHL